MITMSKSKLFLEKGSDSIEPEGNRGGCADYPKRRQETSIPKTASPNAPQQSSTEIVQLITDLQRKIDEINKETYRDISRRFKIDLGDLKPKPAPTITGLQLQIQKLDAERDKRINNLLYQNNSQDPA